MRHAAALLGFSVALAVLGASAVGANAMGANAMGASAMGRAEAARETPSAPLVRAEYYCSPGFEATYGGRCVATPSRDEVDLYLNEPGNDGYGEPNPVRRHHRRHKVLHARS